MQARALWHNDNLTSEVRNLTLESLPNARPLTALFSLISTGTELLVARGLVPDSIAGSMILPTMEGSFKLPVKYGYSLVGTLESGEAVHCLHPHQSHLFVAQDDAYAIPDGIPHKRATLASNLETAVTAVWDSQLQLGERVLVVGFGLVGSLVARVASMVPGCEVDVAEINPARCATASAMGFNALSSSEVVNKSYDLSFNCSASASGLQLCVDALGMEGRAIELSWHGTNTSTLNLGGDFHPMRKQIISSQVGSIPGRMSNRWDYIRRKETVFKLLQDDVFDQHITNIISLDEAASLFNLWRQRTPEGLGYCIDYSL